jgi:hypothetical protein
MNQKRMGRKLSRPNFKVLLRYLRGMKVYYGVYRSPPLDHILSPMNPIHTLTLCFHLNLPIDTS